MTTGKVQTTILAAMWDAIDHWPALTAAIQKKFRTEEDIRYLKKRKISPADIGSKAACSVLTQEIDLTLRTNQGLNWPVVARVDLYLGMGRYFDAHDLIEEVIDAIYQSHPEGITATYLEQATCGLPSSVGSVKVVEDSFGEGETKWSVWNASASFLFAFNRTSIR